MTDIYPIIRNHFGLTDQDEITSATRWDSAPIHADSLDRIELAMEIEEQAKVEIDDADMFDMATIGDLEKWMAEQRKAI